MKQRGFTLIEVLVALVLVSIMALLAWRGVDSMSTAGISTEAHERGAQRLTISLAQWRADLDALSETGRVPALDFDGQRMRLTRRASNATDGIAVVAWTIRGSELLRFAQPAVTTAAGLQASWDRAERWARTPLPEDIAFTVTLMPATHWQIFYFRGDAWSNPLSSSGTTDAASSTSAAGAAAAATATPITSAATPTTATATTLTPTPEGVRLVLTLPQGGLLASFSGTLTRDWVQPTLGATK